MEKEIKRKRNLSMIFGAFAIFFTGYPHIWSVYTPRVTEITGWTVEQSSMCFYLALLFFVVGNIVGGKIGDKKKPIMVLSIGGIVQALGVFLSGFLLVKSPIPIYLTYGVLHGFGQGMVYTIILSTAQKWFPNKKGLGSGIVVTANGLCGLFLAPVSRKIITGFGPEKALFVIGILMGIAWLLSVIFVKIPKKSYFANIPVEESLPKQKNYTSKEMMKTKKFYFLLFAMMFGLMSYFFVSPISQVLQVERGVSENVAVVAVMLGSIMNASARLFIPMLADRAGRVPCVKVVMGMVVVTMGSLVVSKSFLTTLAIIVMYGCYGGIMGNFPSFTSTIFGIKHSGENYGYVMIGVICATIGAPALSSLIRGMGYSENIIFVVGMCCAVFAFVLVHLVGKDNKGDRYVTCKDERIA